MKEFLRKDKILVTLVLALLTVFIFRNYFFKNQVPFPSNLLVSFYSPWRFYEWKEYPNGPPNKPIGFDDLRIFHPFRKFTMDQLKIGEWPLWNPYNFSGSVHLASYQTAVFYPLNIFYFVLPQVDTWSLLVILQPVLSGLFMYLFLKEINLSKKAAFFGSLAFAFSGWMVVWLEEDLVLEHSALWLPLILYSLERIARKATASHLALLVFGITCSILAGFLQMTIYVLVAAFFWSVFRKKTLIFLTSLVTSLLISAVHWLPAVEAYFYSPRELVDVKFIFAEYLMKPWHLITFLVPDFWGNPGAYNYFGSVLYHEKVIFIGISALLLALSTFLVKMAGPKLKFFRWFSLITLALGFSPLGWLLYFSRLPLVSTITPCRIFFLSTFGFCVLAAFGMDGLLARKINWPKFKKILLFVALAFLILGFFTIAKRFISPKEPYGFISLKNLILPAGFFLATTLLIVRRSYFGLVVLTLLSSLYFAQKFLYFSERKFIFPEVGVISKLKEMAGLNRVWSYGNGYWEKNFNIFYGLYSPEGYGALYPQKYGKLLYTQETEGKIVNQILRTDANIATASERDGVLDNWPRRRLLSLLGVKYVIEAKVGEGKDWLTQEKRFPETSFRLVWEDQRFRIWEFLEALPRAFLVNDYLVEVNGQKIVDYLFDKNFNLGKTIVLEKEPGYRLVPGQPAGEVQVIKYEPNRVELEAESSLAALLFLSDNDYPGWKVFIDGKPTEILRADYTFRAVALPEGKHKIVFSYRPWTFYGGLVISVTALFFSLILMLKLRK